MELKSLEGLSLGSVIAGVLSTLAVMLVARLAESTKRHRISARIVFLIANKFSWRLIGSMLVSVFMAWASTFVAPTLHTTVNAPLAGFVVFALLTISFQWRFANIGIHSAQSSVTGGTDYSVALSLCRDTFALLGTGAFKLVNEQQFEQTLLRCSNSQNPIRLLLSNPDNPLIRDAEQRAGVAPGTYRHKLTSSLEILARLRNQRNVKFEVRFYKAETERDFENFRMMFIDDDILLLSYNIYGNEDAGRNTPQLVLFKSRMKSSSGEFYAPFRGYFERLWNSSVSWDFHEYI